MKRMWAGLAGLLALPLVGMIYERKMDAQARRRLVPPGQMIALAGQRWRVRVLGQGHSSPAVILESGAGGFAPEWHPLQAQIAQFARVVTYDRAGHGWSDTRAGVRSPQQIAYELRLLLTAAQVPPPYIYVGHSLGGIYALAFAQLYPADMAGVVLVDASHPRMHERPEIDMPGEIRGLHQAYLRAYCGWQRLRGGGLPTHIAQLPPELGQAYQALRPRSVLTMYHEILAIWNSPPQSFDLGALPLVVLTRAPTKSPLAPAWQALQADLATLSRHSMHMIAEKSSHDVHHAAPQLVVQAVQQLLRGDPDARQNGTLPTANGRAAHP